MPASGKMLKSRQQAANRAAGIGDADGKLPMQIKKPEVMLKCTMCGQEIRATKTNTEAKAHWSSKHAATTYAVCFPGSFDPTAVVVPEPPTMEMSGLKLDAAVGGGEEGADAGAAAAVAPEKPKKKKEDLSFLDAALDPKAAKKGGKK